MGGLLPENGRLQRHCGLYFLNFDTRSILSTWKDALNRRIYNKKSSEKNIFRLKVITVLSWKITYTSHMCSGVARVD